MRKAMPEILPGETTTRTFFYPDGQNVLPGREILVGLSELESDGYLVRRLAITEDVGSLLVTEPVLDDME